MQDRVQVAGRTVRDRERGELCERFERGKIGHTGVEKANAAEFQAEPEVAQVEQRTAVRCDLPQAGQAPDPFDDW